MPKESSLRDQIRIIFTQELGGAVTNHEDKFTKGISDTNFAFHSAGHFFRGWIELKHIKTWPKLWTTEIRLGIRAEQRIWIRERWKHAHDVFVICRIDADIYMFSGRDIDEIYRPISRARFEALWLGKWQYKISIQEFYDILCEQLP